MSSSSSPVSFMKSMFSSDTNSVPTLESVRASFVAITEDLDTIQRQNSEEKADKEAKIQELNKEIDTHETIIAESTTFRNNLLSLIGKKN